MKTTTKTLPILGFCLLVRIVSAQEPGYEITGHLSGAERFKISLEFMSGDKTHTDTAIVSGNQFKITGGKVVHPVMARLWARKRTTSPQNIQDANRRSVPDGGFVNFFLENSKITVTAETDTVRNRMVFTKIEGSRSNNEYNIFSPLEENSTRRRGTPAYGSASFNAYMDSLGNAHKIRTREFIKNYPGSYAIPYILSMYCLLPGVKVENLDSLIKIIDPVILKTPVVEKMNSFVQTFQSNRQKASSGEPPELISYEVNEKAGNGGKDQIMKFEETEHGDNFSIVRITIVSGPSVARAMFEMKGLHKVALQRGKQFFVRLKSWKDEEGNFLQKVGFFDSEDTDLKKTFRDDIGEEFKKESVMSVIQGFGMFGEK